MEEKPARKLAVLLHADVVGSTALVRLDETLAHHRIQDVFGRFTELISRHGGTAHEVRGDALVAEFSKVSDAVAASLDFQTVNAIHNKGLTDDIRPEIRVGIAMGEVLIADNTITGEGIVLAQRLEQLAEPGGVCIHDAAYQTVPKRLPFSYDNLGEQQLKGFDEPVRAYKVVAKETPDPVPTSAESFSRELPEERSLAVLPFANMSGDPAQEYFSDGVTEDIITELSRFRELLVIARNSSFTYKNKAVKTQDVAADLGVRYIVEGSVRTAGKRIRVTVQLIDAETGHHIWAERYDRELTDIFEVQDEITRTVASTVAGRVQFTVQANVARKRPDALNAYDLVLRGRSIVEDSKQKHLQAQQAYKKAVEIDPSYAQAHAGLAMGCLVALANHWTESDEVALDAGLEYASAAVALDHNDSYSQFLRGYFLMLTGRLEEAKIHLDRAVSLNPNDAHAINAIAHFLHCKGQLEQAIDWHLKAIRLNPYHPVWYLWHLGLTYYSARQYPAALETLQEAISRHPAFLFPRKALAATLAQLGRLNEAQAVVEALLVDHPDASMSRGDVYVLGIAPDSQEWSTHWIEGLRKAGMPE